jgi:hypothetical protein
MAHANYRLLWNGRHVALWLWLQIRLPSEGQHRLRVDALVNQLLLGFDDVPPYLGRLLTLWCELRPGFR